MGLFNMLLDEMEQLFKIRGYDEETLKNPDKKGTLYHSLRRNLSRAVNLNDGDETIGFEEKTVGFYNDDKNILVFTFHFEYDPVKTSLAIKQFEIYSEGQKRILMLKRSYDLPHSMHAMKLLKCEDLRNPLQVKRDKDSKGKKP